MVLRFRVYYSINDWQDFDDPQAVERRWGVQGVVFDDPVGRQDPYDIGRYCLCQHDYYVYSREHETWLGLRSDFDLIDWIMHRFDDIACVLKGRILPSAEWKRLERAMKDATGFERKSARQAGVEAGTY